MWSNLVEIKSGLPNAKMCTVQTYSFERRGIQSSVIDIDPESRI